MLPVHIVYKPRVNVSRRSDVAVHSHCRRAVSECPARISPELCRSQSTWPVFFSTRTGQLAEWFVAPSRSRSESAMNATGSGEAAWHRWRLRRSALEHLENWGEMKAMNLAVVGWNIYLQQRSTRLMKNQNRIKFTGTWEVVWSCGDKRLGSQNRPTPNLIFFSELGHFILKMVKITF